jgi:predicted metal-dependent hydrolase
MVTPEATLLVKAPYHVPLGYIEGLVRKKSSWVRRKIAEVSARPRSAVKRFVEGEEFLYLGMPYPLKVKDAISGGVELGGELFISRDALPDAPRAIETWYRRQALKVLTERCGHYAPRIGRPPAAIRVTGASRRWGSCGPRGTVNFSWRIIMAPSAVVDYLVVHELSHLVVHDHSRAFWDTVRTHMPDYRQHEEWLKRNEGLLHI